MRVSTKIGLFGIGVTLITNIVFSVIEIRDYRKGKRRMNVNDIQTISESVAAKLKEDSETVVEADFDPIEV